jgi:cytochrome d ubiquinol oxidase subunit I
MSASSLSVNDLWFSIISITIFYAILLVIELFLMLKFIRIGPSSLKTGRYHFEQKESAYV